MWPPVSFSHLEEYLQAGSICQKTGLDDDVFGNCSIAVPHFLLLYSQTLCRHAIRMKSCTSPLVFTWSWVPTKQIAVYVDGDPCFYKGVCGCCSDDRIGF